MALVLEHGSRAGLPASHFEAGAVLLNEGETTGRLYVLLDGEIEVMRGTTRVTVANQPGAIFGEMSILLGLPHTATVKTVRPSNLHVIESGPDYLRAHPEMAYVIAQLLAQRLNACTTYLVDLARQFEDRSDHLGMVSEVLDSLIHHQSREYQPGPEDASDPRL